jgi:hypothetical protein
MACFRKQTRNLTLCIVLALLQAVGGNVLLNRAVSPLLTGFDLNA